MDVLSSGLTLLVVVLTYSYIPVDSSTITDMETLHTALLAGYNRDIRPIDNQSAPLNVTMYAHLRSIQYLDEVNGEISFTGAIVLQWMDSKLTWDPVTYGGITHTYLSYESVWAPEIILTKPTDELDTLSKKWNKLRYNWTGAAMVILGGRFLASCNVDVQNYPFDKHICNVSFTAWGYDSEDVNLISARPIVDTGEYGGHKVWTLARTDIETYKLLGWSYFNMIFYLERKASFTLVSLVSPLLLMNLLNVLVFVLVPNSGERVSYSITVLLAIAVFMTIVSESLPQSSDPVPKITYKLMADMVISVLITMITILNLRLYHKEDNNPVTARVEAIYRFLRYSRRRKNETKDGHNSAAGIGDGEFAHIRDMEQSDKKKPENIAEYNITWQDISYMVDNISLIVFTGASVMTFVMFVFTTAI